MKKKQDLDSSYVDKIKKMAETLLENESAIYKKGSKHIYLIFTVYIYIYIYTVYEVRQNAKKEYST